MKRYSLLVLLMVFMTVLVSSETQSDGRIEKGQLISVPHFSFNLQTSKDMSVKTIFEENFESNAQNWIQTGSWAIGNPVSGPKNGYNSGNCAKMKLDGGYDNSTDSWLISPRIQLPSASEINLRFFEWYALESDYDIGRVMISTDDGLNWTELISCSGHSDWRETKVNLSRYANQSIQLAFNLVSDDAMTYDGWFIDKVVIETRDPFPLSATMTNLNSQDFPFIYMNVEVDSFGYGTPNLTQSNFQVYENGTLQEDYFEVIPPSQSGGSRLADIVFLMDNSGSMSDEINAVSDHVTQFVNNLSGAGINYSLGLCRFGASQNSGYPIFEDSGILTSDASYFLNSVWTRNVTSGGFEPGWDALYGSVTNFSFRPGAQRVFILITDESVTGNNNQGVYSYAQTLGVLQSNSVTVFALITLNSSSISNYGTIADNTNGAYYNILSDFNDILNSISAQVANSYVVRYRSSNPTIDGVLRNVTVDVNYAGSQAFAYGSYMPGAAPQIVRTQNTLDLHNQSWAEGTTFTIEAEITDNIEPYVQSATLYYKNTASTNYMSVGMSVYSGNIWRGTIPGSAVSQPGLDYYITATDGMTTSSSPSVEPMSNAYQLAILPNYAPAIVHIQLQNYILNQPISIAATVTDNTNNLSSVELFYKKSGQLTYQMQEMSSTGNDVYSGFIPESYATSDGIDYYIKATDNFGLSSHSPLNGYYNILPITDVTIRIMQALNPSIPILITSFNLFMVNPDDPLDEISIGSYTTNFLGRIVIPANSLVSGYNLKVTKVIHTVPTLKANHGAVDNTMYDILVTNARFNPNGSVYYHSDFSNSVNDIIMENTVIRFNLVVSIEWDATQDYIDNLYESFKSASNYLFDVTDGQAIINKIAIYDCKENWTGSDVKIMADNALRANSTVGHLGLYGLKSIKMPRVNHLNILLTDPNYYIQYLNLSDHYRTFIHEMGHYALGFYDEYEDMFGNNHTDGLFFNYGFMDLQYDLSNWNSDNEDNQLYSSEMSTTDRYNQNTYWGPFNTAQYQLRLMSCWGYFKFIYEDFFLPNLLESAIYANIIAGNERFSDSIYFEGPNDNFNNLDYDVGSLLSDLNADCNSSQNTFNKLFTAQINGNTASDVETKLNRKESFLKALNIKQGVTHGGYAYKGQILVLGTKNKDKIMFEKTVDDTLYSAMFRVTNDQGDQVVDLSPARTNLRMIPNLALSGLDSGIFSIEKEIPFVEYPEIHKIDDDGTTSTSSFPKSEDSSYSVVFDSVEDSGSIILEGIDDYGSPYLTSLEISATEIYPEEINQLSSNADNSHVIIFEEDTQAMQKVSILSHNLPTIRNGLPRGSEHAGYFHAFDSYPAVSYLSKTYIKLSYRESELKRKEESSLRVFRWSFDQNEWQLLGGNVNSEMNYVTCPITETGVYGLFTIDEDNPIPTNGGRSYIYPNPFNPNLQAGVIAYDLARDGNVKIDIYNIKGQKVTSLYNGFLQKGQNKISWDGTDDNKKSVPNGIYFCRIQTPDRFITSKLVVLK